MRHWRSAGIVPLPTNMLNVVFFISLVQDTPSPRRAMRYRIMRLRVPEEATPSGYARPPQQQLVWALVVTFDASHMKSLPKISELSSA